MSVRVLVQLGAYSKIGSIEWLQSGRSCAQWPSGLEQGEHLGMEDHMTWRKLGDLGAFDGARPDMKWTLGRGALGVKDLEA